MLKRLIILIILTILWGSGLFAQNLKEDLSVTVSKLLHSNTMSLEVEILIFDSLQSVAPSDKRSGKIMRDNLNYCLIYDFITVVTSETGFLLLDHDEKFVLYSPYSSKQRREILKTYNEAGVADMASILDSVTVIADEIVYKGKYSGGNGYHMIFSGEAIDSISIYFKNDFLSEVTYYYKEDPGVVGNKIQINYRNVSFSEKLPKAFLLINDVIIPGAKPMLKPAYSTYTLQIE